MKVEISGFTLESFLVNVEDATGKEQTFDIAQLLVTGPDLELEIDQCAAQEHFWAQLALDTELALEEFEKTTYDKYLSHIEKYARYYLKGQGEKTMTGTAKEKTAMLIFSNDAIQAEEAGIAYIGYKEEMSRIGQPIMSDKEFVHEMYQDGLPSKEEMELIRISYKHKAAQLHAVSSAFNTKSWNIKTKAADKRATVRSNI